MIVDLTDIAYAMGQVRSEMRFALIREIPCPTMVDANSHLCRFDASIKHFKFRLQSEQRRDPEMQRLLRDLHRLHEDLIHFYGNAHNLPSGQEDVHVVLPPLDMLSAILTGN